MIRQKIKIEIDWDIPREDKTLFKMAKTAILHECLKTFTGIYQAKIEDGNDPTMLTVFKPSAAMKKNIERMRVMKKRVVAMKKKK